MIDCNFTIKKIDQVIGPLLLRIMPRSQPYPKKPATNPDTILIIRPGGMGDAILLLPALKAVSKKFKQTKIDVLCEPRNQDVFHTVAFINRIFSYKKLTDLICVLNQKYDIIIDTEQSHFLTAIITRLSKANLTSGFHTNDRQKMYTISVNYNHNVYEAVSFWNLIRKTLNINETFSWDMPYFKPVKTSLPFDITSKKYICIFPGASVDERLWPEQRWSKIIDYLTQSGWSCVLLGSRKELPQCRIILEYCKADHVINLCSQLTIQETTHVLKTASLLISTDSGILHLGVLCGTPTISLFGPGIALKWAPEGDNHFVINKNTACSPCTKFGTTPPCKHDMTCMKQIAVKDVIRTLRFRLGL